MSWWLGDLPTEILFLHLLYKWEKSGCFFKLQFYIVRSLQLESKITTGHSTCHSWWRGIWENKIVGRTMAKHLCVLCRINKWVWLEGSIPLFSSTCELLSKIIISINYHICWYRFMLHEMQVSPKIKCVRQLERHREKPTLIIQLAAKLKRLCTIPMQYPDVWS